MVSDQSTLEQLEASAVGSVRADGPAPTDAARALVRQMIAGTLTPGQAVAAVAALHQQEPAK
jgi:hypothetical protein